MQPLDQKYKPTKLKDFAGLTVPRAVLGNFAKDPYPAAWLFVGAAGIGKTSMAFALAEQIGGQVYHVPAKACDLETVNRICERCHYRPFTGNWNHVIVDESDQMSGAAQLAFLSKLDGTATPPDTIFWFTANETRLLEGRFQSRCRKLNFTSDGLAAPAASLLERVWKAEVTRKRAKAPDFAAMVEAACFNIREALMLLETEILAPGTFQPLALPEIHEIPALPTSAALAAVKSNGALGDSWDRVCDQEIRQIKRRKA